MTTSTERELLECPRCFKQFKIFKRKPNRRDKCPDCEWDHNFNYPDEE